MNCCGAVRLGSLREVLADGDDMTLWRDSSLPLS